MSLKSLPAIVLVCFLYLSVLHAKSCNEAVCRGIVSKCLLIQSCMCVANNGTCYQNCFDCLGSYTDECCPCFDFCVTLDESIDGEAESQSVVEDFPDPFPGLFKALTEYPDDRWSMVTFPVHIVDNKQKYDPDEEVIFNMQNEDDYSPPLGKDLKDIITFNCTVAFLNDCTSRKECRKNCLMMGANSYRWFHNSCCECVGEKCIYYGIDESRCLNCPSEMEDEDGMEDENNDDLDPNDYYDYDEDDM